jgi:cysteine desulfurase
MKSKRQKPEAGRKVYLDYAGLTPIDKRVMKEIVRVGAAGFANPSSIHVSGVAAKKILEQSRQTAAHFLHAHSDEIFFTASGTEANNIAIRGVVGAVEKLPYHHVRQQNDIHILVSEIEHTSILETVKDLAKNWNTIAGKIKVDFIPVKSDGIVDLTALKKMLRPETTLVSIMLANNDIGTIQPIREAVKIVRDFRKTAGKVGGMVGTRRTIGRAQGIKRPILFHTDACQAPLYLDINMETLGVDLLTLDSNKVYGSRGVGMLYKKRAVKIGEDIVPIITGGGQEDSLRSGTENVPAIAGFSKALEIATAERSDEITRLSTLQNYFVEELKKRVPDINFNGSYAEGKRLVNNINVTFPKKQKSDVEFDHEFFLLELDARGVSCSTKSACLRDEDESYVVRALRTASEAKISAQAIRFSLGRFTTKKDIDYTLKMIDEIMLKRI